MPQVRIMTILNTTPDSFSDGGNLTSADRILKAAGSAISAGTDILDIGGESTRPGAETVDEQEELERVLPAIRAIQREFPTIAISIDTRKAKVAKAALEAGATIVNDVSGLLYDPAMADVCGQAGCQLVLMHSQGTPATMQNNPDYPNGVTQTVYTFFERQIEQAIRAGVRREDIILDPGFGFGKTLQHNLELLNRLSEFTTFGLPVLAGTSRKSFLTLGKNDIPPQEREVLTAASLTLALTQGATYLRIHDPVTQIPAIRLVEATLETTLSSPAVR